jgi:hypothetical protein
MTIAWASLFFHIHDITWIAVPEVICDIIERNLSAFVANLPALWVLVLQMRKKYSGFSAKNRPRLGLNDSDRAFASKSYGYKQHMESSDEVDTYHQVRHDELRQYGNSAQAVADLDRAVSAGEDDIPLREIPSNKDPMHITVQTEFRVEEEKLPRRDIGEVLGWGEPPARAAAEETKKSRWC